MPVNVLPPTPADPVKEGYVRHQFVLIIDKQEHDRILSEKNFEISPLFDFLSLHFGGVVKLAEKVMEGDLHGWRVWLDYAKEDEAKFFSQGDKSD